MTFDRQLGMSLLEMRRHKVKQDLIKREFVTSDTYSLNFKELQIPEIDLSTARFSVGTSRTTFMKCDLRFADCSHSNAISLYITGSNCCFIRFDGSALNSANLADEANRFAGASFRDCDLKQAQFYLNAMLLTADFTGARNIGETRFSINRTVAGSGRKTVDTIVGIGIDPATGRLCPADFPLEVNGKKVDMSGKVLFRDICEQLRSEADYVDSAIVKVVENYRTQLNVRTAQAEGIAGLPGLLGALEKALPVSATTLTLPAPAPAPPQDTNMSPSGTYHRAMPRKMSPYTV